MRQDRHGRSGISGRRVCSDRKKRRGRVGLVLVVGLGLLLGLLGAIEGLRPVAAQPQIEAGRHPAPALNRRTAAIPEPRYPISQVTESLTGVTNEGPAISADGRYIAFASDDLALQEPAPETQGPAGEFPNPVITYLPILVNATGLVTPVGNQEIFWHDLAARMFISVTDTSATFVAGFNHAPAISADGTHIAFVSDHDLTGDGGGLPSNPNIFLAEVTGGATAITRITGAGQGASSAPTICDDGTRIAFVSNSDGNPEVHLWDAVSGPMQITRSAAEIANRQPAISGDGEQIAFISNGALAPFGHNPEANPELFLWDQRTATAQITFTGSEISSSAPAISADGTRVAFLSNGDLDPAGGNADGNVELFLYRAGEFVQVTFTAAPVTNGQPALSRDGLRIVFVSDGDLDPAVGNADGNRELYLYDATTTPGITQVTQTAGGVITEHPAINEDGTRIAFVSNHDGNREIYLATLIPDLYVSQTASTADAAPGDVLTYTIHYGNRGRVLTGNTHIVDTLPAHTRFLSATDGGGHNPAAGSVDWALGALAGGYSGQVTITVAIEPGMPAGVTFLTNRVSISTTTPGEQVISDNSSIALTRVKLADLSLTKRGPASLLIGDPIHYSITVTSTDAPGLTATDVVTALVTDQLPPEITDISWTCAPSQGSRCHAGAGQRISDTVTLPPGGSIGYRITGTLASYAQDSITNTASLMHLAGIADASAANDTDSASTRVNTSGDLTIRKTAFPNPVVAGETLTYTLVYTNDGPLHVHNVVITDALPAETTFDAFTRVPAGLTLPPDPASSHTLTFSLSLLLPDPAAGGAVSRTVEFRVKVDAAAIGQLANSAGISSADHDPDLGNNWPAPFRSEVIAVADLSITKVASSHNITVGLPLTFTLIAANNGPSVARDITITDTLPAGFEPLGSAGSLTPGSPAEPQVAWRIGMLAPGETYTIELPVQISPDLTGTRVNSVVITSTTPDPAPSNNQDHAAVILTPPPSRPGIYVYYDYLNLSPDLYQIEGGHISIPWGRIEWGAGRYDWKPVEDWIALQTPQKKLVGLGFNSYDGQCCGGIGMPAHIKQSYPGTVVTCPGGIEIPRYWDPIYQREFSRFVHVLGQRYDTDPRVAWIELGVGMYGETTPAEDELRGCLKTQGLTSAMWVDFTKWVVDLYLDAFPNTQLFLQYAPVFDKRNERIAFTDYAASLGVGLKHNGLKPDGAGDAIIDEPGHPNFGGGQYDPVLKWGHLVATAWEAYENQAGSLRGRTDSMWGIYNALDKHAGYLVLDTDLIRAPDRQDLLQFAHRYLARSLTDTPSVWVAMRETEFEWFPDYGNYEFWLYQLDSAPNGQTVPVWNIGDAAEGRYARRTDQASGNHSMYFDVDDGYANGGQNSMVVTITYYDQGVDRWELRYDAVGNTDKVGGVIYKTNTLAWKQATFSLSDAHFANRQPGGADFRIWSGGDGDEILHMADVKDNS